MKAAVPDRSPGSSPRGPPTPHESNGAHLKTFTVIYKALFFLGWGVLSAILFLKQASQQAFHAPDGIYFSDLPSHLELLRLSQKGDKSMGHPGFHYAVLLLAKAFNISLEVSAAIILSAATMAIALAIYMALRRSLATTLPDYLLLLFSGSLMLVSAIYAPFFNKHIYLGQGSPNAWHNPTLLMVKPLSFACVMMFASHAEDGKGPMTIKEILAIAASLFLSSLIKPNFALIFIPAMAIYVALNWRTASLAWQSLVTILPTICLLGWQYLASYKGTAAGDSPNAHIIPDFLGVWQHWSPNILASSALVLAFPLSILIFRFRAAQQDFSLKFAWLLTIVGFLQYSLLAESGDRYLHGNWGWGRLIALQLLFVYSFPHFVRWVGRFRNAGWRERLQITSVATIFILHFASGTYYFARIYTGGSYY